MAGKLVLYLGLSAAGAAVLDGCGGATSPATGNPGGAAADTTRPTVASVSPAAGAIGVSRSASVIVTFSEPFSPGSVTPSTFSVGTANGSVSVSGVAATFTPDAPLNEGATYQVSLTGARDTAGNTMAAPFTSTFTTSAAPVPVQANAGTDRDVSTGAGLTLDGSASTGNNLAYTWTQIDGPAVSPLAGPTPGFTAPTQISTLGFALRVSDGNTTSSDTVRIWVLENAAQALFVSATGSDANPGTRTAPLATVQAAMDRADDSGNGADVYVAGGEYAGSISLRSRVSVYGGFDPVTWERKLGTVTSTIRGGPVAVSAANVNELTLEGLRVVSADAADSGQSSIGVLLSNAGTASQKIRLTQNVIVAGAGFVGRFGAAGSAGSKGENGSNGAGSGVCDNLGGAGGNTPAGVAIGGTGGKGGAFGGFDGDGGEGAGGGGGSGGPTAGAGGAADSGRVGSTGSAGSGGASRGTVGGAGYTPANGGSGGAGSRGSAGGGGGGGGGGVVGLCGGGGGGGGAGGLGGAGGGGGQGGGASIGVALAGTTFADLNANVITTGTGGAGGNGGTGGSGGAFGTAGTGGAGGGGGAAGGDGGRGGRGGRGGHGGGGGGGPTIGIVDSETATSNTGLVAANTFIPGTPGAGGAGAGNAGAAGQSSSYQKLP